MFLLSLERINKQFTLKVEETVRKIWAQGVTLSVVELSLTVHFALFPVTNIHVTNLISMIGVFCRLGPRELPITVELFVKQISSVL